MELPRCENRSHAQAQRSRSNHSTLCPRALTARHMPTKSFSALGALGQHHPSLSGTAEPACNTTGLYKCLKQQRACAPFPTSTRPSRRAPSGHEPKDAQTNGTKGNWAHSSAGSPCLAGFHQQTSHAGFVKRKRPQQHTLSGAATYDGAVCQQNRLRLCCSARPAASVKTGWPARTQAALPPHRAQ